MNKSITERILKLNRDFYQLHGVSFSDTRAKPWKGWDRILDILKASKKDSLSVLDLGCGNGRFFTFLDKNFRKDFKYLGLDLSNPLLDIAIGKYGKNKNYKQKKFDVISDVNKIEGVYDIVVAFGLTHHIPSQVLRKGWFNAVARLVNNGGVLILTFWDLDKKEIAEVNTKKQQNGLDAGDVYIGWKEQKGELRYVHTYSHNEINKIIEIQKTNGLILQDRFSDDRAKNSSNLYLVFKRV
jgi:SAM-dependent methyltransferase